MSIREIYETTIRPLTAAEQVELAKIILDELPKEALVDFRDDWTDEDLKEFGRSTWRHAEEPEHD